VNRIHLLNLVLGTLVLTVVLSCTKAPDNVPGIPWLAVFTETHTGVSANAALVVKGSSATVVTNGQLSEGYEGLQVQVASLGWMRFDMTAPSPKNLSGYTSGYLNFSIKTTSTKQFMAGIKSSDNAEAWVPLTASHYTNDGKWHSIAIPVSSFAGVDLTKVTNYFMITNSNATANNDVIYLDDVFWSSNSASAGTFWELKWSDEFTNAAVDTSVWSYDLGASGWGNNELDWYTSTNATISNGDFLAINCYNFGAPTGATYSSSRMKTQGTKSFQYGRIMARMRLAVNAQGAWPAFWMLGNSGGWPANGEIDIMECGLGGSFNSIGGALHWANSLGDHASTSSTVSLSSGTIADAFHIFEIEWNASSISWKMDGVMFKNYSINSSDMSEFHQQAFIIINLAVGGPGTPYTGFKPVDYIHFPQSMFVDWVRVYQVQP
jgi:beta-glucanase (GH16 family)